MGPDDDDIEAAEADWELIEGMSADERREGVVNAVRDIFGDERLAQRMGELAAEQAAAQDTEDE